MKKWLLCLLAVLMVLSIAACNKDTVTASDKVFSSNGMNITLTSAFKESRIDGYTVVYDSPEIAVFGLREAYADAAQLKDMTLSEYADIIYKNNSSKSPKPVSTVDGLTVIEYEFHNEKLNKNYSYFTVMFKCDDCFWMVQFTCETKNYEANRPYFINWAKTVTFTSAAE